ncbi:MAG TPA: NADH-quinone oxidoreductase subunit NuoK [Thermodesulfobacteriota bacterium]|nr:NADH-quinone oxidoreductase subunit NuoK [Thermodesulfobacteriota bacterium]
MMVPASHYLLVSAVLFTVGIVGAILRRDALTAIMCVSVLLNALTLTFVTIARELASLDGQVIGLFLIAVITATMVTGLAIIISAVKEDGADKPERSIRRER